MAEHRIGSTQIQQDAAALVLYCPALRSAAPALMLALFGVACSFIALASLSGLVGHGGDGASNLLALAFAGVFVLPLISIGTVFIAIALWTALNALTVAATRREVRADRRWCGLPLARKSSAWRISPRSMWCARHAFWGFLAACVTTACWRARQRAASCWPIICVALQKSTRSNSCWWRPWAGRHWRQADAASTQKTPQRPGTQPSARPSEN